MAELDVRAYRKGRGTYQAIVTNRGPDTVILNKIEGSETDGFLVDEPLHRADLELIPGARHEFMVAPSLADAPPLEVDITFTDQSESGRDCHLSPLVRGFARCDSVASSLVWAAPGPLQLSAMSSRRTRGFAQAVKGAS
jgi:hypothetical protein